MIGWIAVSLSILGLLFNSKKLIVCWPIWIIGDLVWIFYAIPYKQWPIVFLQIIFLIINIYGWIQWNKTKIKGSVNATDRLESTTTI